MEGGKVDVNTVKFVTLAEKLKTCKPNGLWCFFSGVGLDFIHWKILE